MADVIIEAVRGDHERRGALAALWKEESLKWLDAWSADREFVVEYDLEEISPGLLTKRTARRKPPEKAPAKAPAKAKKAKTAKGQRNTAKRKK